MSTNLLAPLTADELRLCSAAVRSHFRDTGTQELVRFNAVETLEPPKREWFDKQAADDAPLPRRRARAVVSVGRAFYELDVLLLPSSATVVQACRPIDLSKGQPLATAEDCLLAESVARADDRVAAACARSLSACFPALASLSSSPHPLSPAQLLDKHVALDPWALHHCPDEWYATTSNDDNPSTTATPRRVMAVFAYAKPSPAANEYARPLPVTAAVDLNEMRVIAVEEWGWEKEEELEDRGRRRRQVAEEAHQGEFAPELLAQPLRANPPRPLVTRQPRGPSFSSPPDDPWRVLWQGWSFRVGFTLREGLVLHDVSFAPFGGAGGGDGDNNNGNDNSSRINDAFLPVAHRLSVAEMAVPYSDPRPPYNRRCALDAGDYGLGAAAVPQSACADCAGGGDVRYFSPILSDAEGEPRVVKNAVCLHEVDAGVLWKHADYRTGTGPVRRARELVVNCSVVAVNYDYLFSWVFGLDGGIRLEVRLTGVLSTNRLTRDEAARYGGGGGGGNEDDGLPTHGTLVAPRVVAGHHQHLFCARLDLSVGDKRRGGRGLRVSEVDPVRASSSSSSSGVGVGVGAGAGAGGGDAGNGFEFSERVLPARGCSGRDAAVGRVWRVSDPRSLHAQSRKPRAYELRLASPATLLASADSSAARRAVFATKSVWVTPHEDGDFFPTGRYAMNARKDTGPMTRWCFPRGGGGEDGDGDASRASLADEAQDDDPVLWVTFGVTHEVRSEDFPVMNRDLCSIELRPHNFLDGGNPAVDLPAPSTEDGAREVAAAATGGAAARSRL